MPLPLRSINARQYRLKQFCAQQDIALSFLATGSERHFIVLNGMCAGEEIAFYLSRITLLELCELSGSAINPATVDDALYLLLAESCFSGRHVRNPLLTADITQIEPRGFIAHTRMPSTLVSLGDDVDRLWFDLEQMPLPATPPLRNHCDWSGLAFQAQINLGHTLINAGLLRTLASGDVLIINAILMQLLLDQQTYCGLEFDGEKFYLKEKNMDFDEMTQALPEDAWSQSDERIPLDMEQLRVNVHFYLGAESMTLSQLQHLNSGDVLPLLFSDAQSLKVNLMVQNHTIATGELVLMNEKLAVEINTVCGMADRMKSE